MKKQIVSTTFTAFGLLLVLALGVMLGSNARPLIAAASQGSGYPPPAVEGAPVFEAMAPTGGGGRLPYGHLNYQGQLLQNDAPYNGNINITFRLYDTFAAVTPFWEETQNVAVSQGLFNVELGATVPISPSVASFDNQLWLGIQPAGAASELAPRETLTAAPYAYSLIPGATMYDWSTGPNYTYSFRVISVYHPAIYGKSTTASGVIGDTEGTHTNGVVGQAWGNDSHGVLGWTGGSVTSCPSSSVECAAALQGTATGGSAYGAYLYSDARSGLIATTTSTSFFALYATTPATTESGIGTNGTGYFGGYVTFAGGKSGYVVDIAYNAGKEPLQQGDVVVIVGSLPAVVGEIPVIQVAKADSANATGVVGVVDVLYEPCTKTTDQLQAGEACGGYQPNVTTIQPGQYLGIVTLGAYKMVRVDASAGAIQPGDLLAAAPHGMACKAQALTVEGVSFFAPGTIIGKALGGLDKGDGFIPVFVSLK